jgi:hypothetical protein
VYEPEPEPEDRPSMDWTKAELTEFAEEHDPPITIPSGSNKAEILALIQAATTEEN